MARGRTRFRNMCQSSLGTVSKREVELSRETVNQTPLRVAAESRLALMEMRIALANLIWHYDLSLKPGQGVPRYFHRSLSAGRLEVCLKKVVRQVDWA